MSFNKNLQKKFFTLTVISGLAFSSFAIAQEAEVKKEEIKPICTTSLEIVQEPAKYLDKQVKVKATFDKFSTLGLDYKPAFKDSKDYITILIKRDDVTDHTIPLSELKLFVKRDFAEEKLIDLETGDKIEFDAKIFSNALGDAWAEINHVSVLTTKKEKTANK